MDIEELKRLALAATPGPWETLGAGHPRQHQAVTDGKDISLLTVVYEGDTPFGALYNDADAAYIAAANPAAVLELIAERDELLARVAEWERCAQNWLASPEAVQRQAGYRELAQRANVAEQQRDELLAALKRVADLFPSDEYMKAEGKVPGPELVAMREAIAKAEGKS